MNNKKYLMPAEWEKHKGTLLAWPSNEETWEGVKEGVEKEVAFLISIISKYENVYVSVKTQNEHEKVNRVLENLCVDKSKVFILDIPNNDSWMRDYGPNYVFLCENNNKTPFINDWGYNAWGGKYPPWDNDFAFTGHFAKWIKSSNYQKIEMILEGGSIDVNGEGIVLTTESCLLNKNRNPNLTKKKIEENLRKYLGVTHIIWLREGIRGDDTDGHIDDFARFINKNTILCNYAASENHPDYKALKDNYNTLINNKILNENFISIYKLPVPRERFYEDIRLPVSYANFYFVNGAVLVPIFNCDEDKEALSIIKSYCPERDVVGIPAENILRGLGGVHCLTQQVY